MEKYYRGFVLDCCIKDRKRLKQFKIVKVKRVFWGLVKILEIEIEESKIEQVISFFQENMVDHIGFKKQYFFVHFYCEGKGMVVFNEKIFKITRDTSTWQDAISYGESLGIITKQLNFEEKI